MAASWPIVLNKGQFHRSASELSIQRQILPYQALEMEREGEKGLCRVEVEEIMKERGDKEEEGG